MPTSAWRSISVNIRLWVRDTGPGVPPGAADRIFDRAARGAGSRVTRPDGTGIGPTPLAALGTPPQDKKFAGEKTTLTIGRDNVIREHVTMNPGTEGGALEGTPADARFAYIKYDR